MTNSLVRAAMVSLLVWVAPAGLCAQRTHVIQGRVTTDSGAVIAAADVIVTIAPSAETVTGKSDAAGTYRIVISNPTGEYLLYVGALGRKPFRQRVTMAATDTVATVNVKLAGAVTTVAAVRVQARKARPPRSLGSDQGLGTDPGDKSVDGVTGALPPDLQGNLEAMASFIPGLSVGMGVSAFGLGPEANSTTLNGLAFGGSDLPRDARTQTRFKTSPWDPTVGGFSGVQTSTTLNSGDNITRRTGHLTFDAPALQFSDPVASRLGQKTLNLALDQGGTGAYQLDKFYYNFGTHAARQTAAVASLADLDPEALARAGISPDSAARLAPLLAARHLPIGGGGIPDQRRTTTLSFIDRIDRAAAPTPASAPAGPVRAMTVFGRFSQSDALSLSPTIEPSSTGKSTAANLGVQGLYSRFFGNDGDYVSETTSGLTLATTHGTPYLQLPGGSVLVASDSGLGSLGFGGNSALANDSRTVTWETINQTNFLLRGHQSLPMKFYLQSRLDAFDQSLSANRLGRFNYASLADLAANRPSSFSRTLNAPDRSGGEWIGAAAFGGNWNTTDVNLTGGLRLNANAFTRSPSYNADLAQRFGVRNDYAPNSISVSPRLGFTWRYAKPTGTFGDGPSIEFSPMAQVFRSGAQLRGGIGKFRSNLPTTLLADATSNNGLSGGVQQLLCIGAAAPAANWEQYSADPSTIPSVCANGAANFIDTARAVTLFDRSYRPSESWRGTLGWTNGHLLGMYVAIDAAYSMNLDQASTVDLNFAGTPRFTLAAEGGRPVFVNPSSIVPSTGTLSPVESRLTGTYGRVNDRMSDLRSWARQVSVTSLPNVPFSWGQFIFGYTFSETRAQSRGFDGSTAGDPRLVEWGASAFTPRHQFTAQLSHIFGGGLIGVSGALRTSSGFTFSPTVAGDINGDGSSNDRAFVFNPAAVGDAALARGLNDLLSNGSPVARECLQRQLGAIAGRNSCVGPWFSTMNGNIVFLRIPHSNNTRATISFANLPGALDQLLHGSSGAHGWGVLPLPDPTLYQVKGFDPTARQFLYQVNPRFGSSDPSTTTRRTPFRITLDVQLTLGRSVAEQQVEQNLRVRPSLVGTRAPVDSIKSRYLRTGFSDIYALLLRNSDSLALSRHQVELLQARQVKLRAGADSIFGRLAAQLVILPANFSPTEAVKLVTASTDAMWEHIYAEKPFLLETLSPGQIRLLPGPIYSMVTVANFKGRFFFGGGF